MMDHFEFCYAEVIPETGEDKAIHFPLSPVLHLLGFVRKAEREKSTLSCSLFYVAFWLGYEYN